MTEIVIPYKPREVFTSYHDSEKRWRVIVAHRRCGKTVACVNELIRSALTCPRKDPRVAYIAPLHKQAKDVAWSYVKEYSRSIPGRSVNESELRVDFPNGGRVRLYGADNPDALRGIYLDDCVLDEFADMRPRFLPEVLRPALSDRQGKLTLIGTPKGRNEFFEAYTTAHTDPEWFRVMLRASETGIIPKEELDSAKRMMSENQYAQEYECSFEAAIEGSYYGSLIEKAEQDGRICPLPHRPDLPVYTGWDLGVGDDTSIWFLQRSGGYLHLIDHYYNRGLGAPHYVELINRKPYSYAYHYFPHDIDRADGWINATNRLQSIRQLGLKNVVVVGKVPVEDGIHAVRNLLPIMRFDTEKTAEGLESLRQYRAKYDEERRCFMDTPLKDWTTHDADAMRYLCLGLEPERAPYQPPRYSQERRRWQASGIGPPAKSWKTA